MDPLSITAGTIAVIGLVSKTCEGLYDAVETFSDVSADLRQHLGSIRSLEDTLTTISELIEQEMLHPLLDKHFESRLRTCMDDLREMELLAQSYQDGLEQGRRSKVWARIRLSMKDRRKILSAHLKKIESYHRNFCLDLLLLNIRQGLSAKHSANVERNITTDVSDKELGSIPTESHHNILSNQFHIRDTIINRYKGKSLAIHAYIGSLDVMEKMQGRCKKRVGYGLSIVALWPSVFSRQLEITLHLISMKKIHSFCFQLQWHLSLPTVIMRNAIIFQLAMKGDVAGMQAHFETGACNPFCVSPDGVTLLHVAASEGHIDAVRFLIRLGAKVNAVDDYGETPLHSAVAVSQNFDICRLILDHGGDVLFQNDEGKTPLHTYFTSVLANVLTYHEGYLINCLTADRLGMTLLHYLAYSSKISRAVFERYYASCAITPGLTDLKGMNLLLYAVKRGNIPVITFLLEKERSSMYQKDVRGRTAMDLAHTSIRGADVSALLQIYREKMVSGSQVPQCRSPDVLSDPRSFWTSVKKVGISRSRYERQECLGKENFSRDRFMSGMFKITLTALLALTWFVVAR